MPPKVAYRSLNNNNADSHEDDQSPLLRSNEDESDVGVGSSKGKEVGREGEATLMSCISNLYVISSRRRPVPSCS